MQCITACASTMHIAETVLPVRTVHIVFAVLTLHSVQTVNAVQFVSIVCDAHMVPIAKLLVVYVKIEVGIRF